MHWLEIYPVDSTIHLLNNWGQMHKWLKVKFCHHEKSQLPCETIHLKQPIIKILNLFYTVKALWL